jgi:hypothetical protein
VKDSGAEAGFDLVIQAATKLGIEMAGVDASIFMKKKPVIVLDTLWHIFLVWIDQSVKTVYELQSLGNENKQEFKAL